jgi:hypothetical protein
MNMHGLGVKQMNYNFSDLGLSSSHKDKPLSENVVPAKTVLDLRRSSENELEHSKVLDYILEHEIKMFMT